MTKRQSRNKNKGTDISWAKAFRDIVVTSINKGQFPLVALFLLVAIVIWRVPSEVLGELLKRLFEGSFTGIYGYIVSLVLALSWFAHSKHMRSEHSKELERIGREKSQLQAKASNRTFKSSNL